MQPAAVHEGPMGPRELLALVLWVIAADLALFRSLGYSGPALFLVAGAVLLWLGRRAGPLHQSWILTSLLLLGVSVRLVCCGSPWLVIMGWALLLAWAMTLAGAVPLVLETVAFIGHVILGGGRRRPRHPSGGLRGAPLQRRPGEQR
jgi:hypothetical protein